MTAEMLKHESKNEARQTVMHNVPKWLDNLKILQHLLQDFRVCMTIWGIMH